MSEVPTRKHSKWQNHTSDREYDGRFWIGKSSFLFEIPRFCVPFTGRVAGYATSRLLQRNTRRTSCVSAQSTSVDFKLAVLTYRCLHGLAPRYLSDYIQSVAVSNCRRLRSLSSSQLVIRRTRLSTVADRAFPVATSGTVCRPTSPQLQRCLFLETASKLISFPDHLLPNCVSVSSSAHRVWWWFSSIHTLGHSK